MTTWRAWDGKQEWNSRDHKPQDLPNELQFVVVYKDATHRVMLTGQKHGELDMWYCFYKDGLVVEDEGVRREVQQRRRQAILKMGVWAADEVYDAVCKKAWDAPWLS